MKIITITGFKGGVGKSTTAIHIADYFSDRGKTLLVDGDPNRTALSWSNAGKLPFKVLDERQALKAIAQFDYAVIDTPARPDSDDLKELGKGCDLMVLPTSPDSVSLQPTLETVKAVGSANFRILLTLIPPYPNREGSILRAELKSSGIPVFETLVRRSVGFQKAAYEGVSIRHLKDKTKAAWRDYQGICREIEDSWK